MGSRTVERKYNFSTMRNFNYVAFAKKILAVIPLLLCVFYVVARRAQFADSMI